MGTVDDLILFSEIVEAGSLTAASLKTGIPKSTLSRRIDALEKGLGIDLFLRSSRNFSPTEIGKSIYERGQKIKDELTNVRTLVEARNKNATGALRVVCPTMIAESLVASFAISFARENPEVCITLDATGTSFDPKIGNYDFAIQPAREAMPNTELVRQKLTTVAHRLVASPEFVHSLGKAPTLASLKHCDAIGWNADGFSSHWKLLSGVGKPAELKVTLKFNGNNLNIIRQAALNGLGLARLPQAMCEDDLREGRLVAPLAGWLPPTITIYALYPSRRSLSLAARLFICGLAKHAKKFPL